MYWGMPFNLFEHCFHAEYVKGPLTEIERYSIQAMLMNDDTDSAIRMLADWGKFKVPEEAKVCEIARFDPGTHFYCLGKKFDSEKEARDHAEKEGQKVVRVFTVDGSGANAAALKEVLRRRGAM